MTGDEISVRDVRVQQRLMNPGGRDIVTDVMVYGEDGSDYNAEPNTYADGSLIERGIYHTYLVGSRLLKSGEEWRALRRGAVTMLNRHDVFGKGEAVIKVEPCIISGGKKEFMGMRCVSTWSMSPTAGRWVLRGMTFSGTFSWAIARRK